jgi:predicted nucleotidyltransferase
MWKKQKIWSSLRQKIKPWINHHKVNDVILFGSFVRGKLHPNDIDLCLVLENQQEKEALELVNSLAKELREFKVQVNHITTNDFLSGKNTLVKAFLIEGISIKEGREVARRYGLEAKTLFFYKFKNPTSSEKVRFHYLLQGRYGREGLLSQLGGKLLSEGVIEIPLYNEELLKDALKQWPVEVTLRRILSGA